MPVEKFHSADEAARALMREGREGRRSERIRSLLAFAARVSKRRYPTGVRRYRSLEEADADRRSWLREHVQRRQAG